MRECSLLNWFINNLPFELHFPGYNYCGPGTNLQKKLERGIKGVNLLDEYCKDHDLAYTKYSSLKERHRADLKLMKMAKRRSSAADASFGEKIVANLVNKAMLAKVSTGSGLKRSKKCKIIKRETGTGLKNKLKNIIKLTKNHLLNLKPATKKAAIKLAIAAAKELTPDFSVKVPRIIPVPKTGGVIPLIPIFAGLSAVGRLTGGASGIAKVIGEFKAAKKRLLKLKKHNETFKSLCIGQGLQLKRDKNSLKIHLQGNSYNKKN